MLSVRRKLYSWVERAALATGGHHAGAVRGWSADRRLVFVCTGNICRSPYADWLARSRGLSAISAGIDTTPGLPADPSAIAEATARGIDLSAHRTRRWNDVDLRPSDIVIATQLSHAHATKARAGERGVPVIMMSSLLPRFEIVWDPYGRPRDAFVYAFDLVDRAIDEIERLGRAARQRAAHE